MFDNALTRPQSFSKVPQNVFEIGRLGARGFGDAGSSLEALPRGFMEMKKVLFSLSLLGSLGLTATAFAADLPSAPPPPMLAPAPFTLFGITGLATAPVVVQFGPTTAFSTINCANFTKLPTGAWKALDGQRFGLGYVQNIVPPMLPIVSGGFIYNNVDLYSQLEAQCSVTLVRARY